MGWLSSLFGSGAAGGASAAGGSVAAGGTGAGVNLAGAGAEGGSGGIVGGGGGASMPGMGGMTSAIPSITEGINKGTAGIAGYRLALAEAKQAERIAGENERRVYAIQRHVATQIRALTGAQGTTMSGNPAAAELDALEQARIMANDEKYRGKVASLALRKQANESLWQGIEGFTGGIVKAGGILSRRT